MQWPNIIGCWISFYPDFFLSCYKTSSEADSTTSLQQWPKKKGMRGGQREFPFSLASLLKGRKPKLVAYYNFISQNWVHDHPQCMRAWRSIYHFQSLEMVSPVRKRKAGKKNGCWWCNQECPSWHTTLLLLWGKSEGSKLYINLGNAIGK